jgi:hypothetical protein
MNVERPEAATRHANVFLAHHLETLAHFHPGHLAIRLPGIAHLDRGGNECLRRIEFGHPPILPPADMTDEPMFIERH